MANNSRNVVVLFQSNKMLNSISAQMYISHEDFILIKCMKEYRNYENGRDTANMFVLMVYRWILW